MQQVRQVRRSSLRQILYLCSSFHSRLSCSLLLLRLDCSSLKHFADGCKSHCRGEKLRKAPTERVLEHESDNEICLLLNKPLQRNGRKPAWSAAAGPREEHNAWEPKRQAFFILFCFSQQEKLFFPSCHTEGPRHLLFGRRMKSCMNKACKNCFPFFPSQLA